MSEAEKTEAEATAETGRKSAQDSESIAHGARLGLIAGIAQGVMKFLSSLLITRVLGAELYGVFVLANRVTRAGSVFSQAGLNDAVMHFVGRYRGQRAPEKVKGAFWICLAIGIVWSLIIALGLYCAAPWVASTLFDSPALTPVIEVLTLAIPLTVVSSLITAALRASRDVKSTLIVRSFVVPGTRLILLALFFLAGLRVFGLAWAFVLALAIGVVVGSIFLSRLRWFGREVKSVLQPRKIVVFSLPLLGLSLLNYANSSTDVLILGYFHEALDVGVYGLVMAMVTMLQMPIMMLSTMYVPMCAEYHGAGDLPRLRELFQTTASWGLRATLPLYLAAVLAARPFLSLFGEDFVAGTTPFIIGGTIAVSNVYAVLAGYAVYMAGRSGVVTLNAAFLAAVSISLYWFLVPEHSIVGAATGRAIAWAAFAALTIIEANRLLGIRPFSRDIGKALLAGGISFGVCHAILRIDGLDDSVIATIAVTLAFLAMYAGLVYKLGITTNDRIILDKLKRRFGLGGR